MIAQVCNLFAYLFESETMATSDDLQFRIRLGRTRYDPATFQLTDENKRPISIREKSLRVLSELAARNGEIVSKDDLFDTVWSGKAISDDSLVQCIKDIRRALGDANHTLLRTTIGRGYSLHGLLDMPVKKGELPKLLISKLRVTQPTRENVELAEAINEELIAAVSPRSGLNVTSEENDRQAVHYTINGRISTAGNNVRVFVQMTKTQSGDVAFIERWNVPRTEIQNLPVQVAEKITSVSRIHMFNHEGEDVVDRDDCDLDTQELLAKAAYHMSRIQMRDCDIARTSLSVAIEREPSHPMALAMRASTTVLLVLQEGISKIPDDPAYSMELAERAVSLAPHVDFVLLTRACQRLWLLGDHEGARADLERALKITPTFHLAHQFLAISEILCGEHTAGIARLEKIIELGKANNPRIPHYLTLLALGELLSGNVEAAAHAAREAHEQAPHDPWCSFVYVAAIADNRKIVPSKPLKSLIQNTALPFDHFRQLPFKNGGDVDYLEQRLRQAGYPQSI